MEVYIAYNNAPGVTFKSISIYRTLWCCDVLIISISLIMCDIGINEIKCAKYF